MDKLLRTYDYLDVNTYPCLSFNGGLTKPQLKLEYA